MQSTLIQYTGNSLLEAGLTFASNSVDGIGTKSGFINTLPIAAAVQECRTETKAKQRQRMHDEVEGSLLV